MSPLADEISGESHSKSKTRLQSSASQRPIHSMLDIDIPDLATFRLKATPFGLVVESFSGRLFFLQKPSVPACLGGHLRLISL
jgi:hypothetical protein